MDQPVRICLWSGPRNISTALMYSFAQRRDTQVIDEPLYAHYLRYSQAQHPGKSDILRSQDSDGMKVIEQVILGNYTKPVVFFKQMAHHLVDLPEHFLHHTQNILLIRSPRAVLNSFSQIIESPRLEDIGIQQQYHMFSRWSQQGIPPLVLDSQEVLLNPGKVLRALCQAMEIPYEPDMLHWEAGPRPEDGVWAPYWYANVHRSTGFQPFRPKEIHLSPELEEIAMRAAPYYDFLQKKSIKSGS